MLRDIGATLAGLAVSIGIITAVQMVGHSLWPPPEGLDWRDAEVIRTYTSQLPFLALLFPIVSYFLGRDRSWLFHLAGREVRAHPLPPRAELPAPVARLRRLARGGLVGTVPAVTSGSILNNPLGSAWRQGRRLPHSIVTRNGGLPWSTPRCFAKSSI